jgi:hypothetical protein
MLKFTMKHPRMTKEALGFIPSFLDANDPRPAREQLHDNYTHGGGFTPFNGFDMTVTGNAINYPGDPPQPLLAEAKLRDEIIRVYDGAWVAVVQPDDSFVIARMD